MSVCIYCRSVGDGWPVEHILPQMFGRYEPDNLVLRDVCPSCNNSFSKLEQVLGRDTPEAIQRIIYGLKPWKAAAELANRRLSYVVDRPGPWFGARVVLAGDYEMYPVFLPQAAFQLAENDPWHWLLEEDITAETVAPYLAQRHRVKLTGDPVAEMDRVQRKLEALGVKFPDPKPLEVPTGDDGKLEVGIEAVIDQDVFRAVAKIAFNYLAYVAGPLFVMHPDFDELKKYVLSGIEPAGWWPMGVVAKKVLLGDTTRWRRTQGHILALAWNRDDSSPVVFVSFFNGTTYRVTMTRNYHGVWIPLEGGHHFDYENRRISTITGYRPRPV